MIRRLKVSDFESLHKNKSPNSSAITIDYPDLSNAITSIDLLFKIWCLTFFGRKEDAKAFLKARINSIGRGIILTIDQ